MNDQVLSQPSLESISKLAEQAEQTGEESTEEPVYKFDLNAAYEDPDDPSKVIDGNTLKTRLNLGTLSSKFQSQRDTAIARAQELAQKLDQTNQQLAQLQKQAAAREQEQSIAETLNRLGFKPQQQEDAASGGSEWLQEEETPQLTQQQVLQELGKIEQRLKKTTEDEVKAIIDRYNQENMISEQSRQRVEGFVTLVRQADEAQMRSDMPDVDDDIIRQISKLHEASRALEMKAVEAANKGDLDKAEEAYVQAQGRSVEARNLQAEAWLKQQEAAAERERKEQTEMFGPGSAATKALEGIKRSFNKGKSKEAHDKFVEGAREVEKNIARYVSE